MSKESEEKKKIDNEDFILVTLVLFYKQHMIKKTS